MDPNNLMDAQHKDGDTMAEDWGQEYGPKQFQWRKDDPTHQLDDFDKNIARDATSAFDKKHAFPDAPVDMTGVQSMDTSKLGEHGHKDGDTMAEDWGQEYGPKQFQWRKDEPKHSLDAFDKNLLKDGASPAGAPAGAPGRSDRR